uniref:Uncharacterized protein n=1 Tax=Populus trichocarpa TaxID=3694 RepID=B9HXQ3_POPTR
MGLHSAHGSIGQERGVADPALRVCRPQGRKAGLQTRGSQGWTLARTGDAGLLIQPCEPLNPRAVRTDIGGWVCTQRAGQEARSAGCRPYLACLQTRSPWGCSQARRSAPSTPGVAHRTPGVYMLGPRPALALGGSSLGRSQVHMANPSPRPVSPSARYSQP